MRDPYYQIIETVELYTVPAQNSCVPTRVLPANISAKLNWELYLLYQPQR